MRTIIATILGIAVFIGTLFLINLGIKAITSGMSSPDLQIILRVCMWIFFGGLALMISSILALIVAGAADSISFNSKKRRNR